MKKLFKLSKLLVFVFIFSTLKVYAETPNFDCFSNNNDAGMTHFRGQEKDVNWVRDGITKNVSRYCEKDGWVYIGYSSEDGESEILGYVPSSEINPVIRPSVIVEVGKPPFYAIIDAIKDKLTWGKFNPCNK